MKKAVATFLMIAPALFCMEKEKNQISANLAQESLQQEKANPDWELLVRNGKLDDLRGLFKSDTSSKEVARAEENMFKSMIYRNQQDKGLILAAYEEGKSDIMHFLLDSYLKVCRKYVVIDNEGNTLLSIAVRMGDVPLIVELIKKKVYINAVNMKGDTPLHDACRLESDKKIRIIKKLLAAGADINKTNAERNAPLHIACLGTVLNKDVIDLLVRANAKIDIKNVYGNTPLECACVTHYLFLGVIVGKRSEEEIKQGYSSLIEIITLLNPQSGQCSLTTETGQLIAYHEDTIVDVCEHLVKRREGKRREPRKMSVAFSSVSASFNLPFLKAIVEEKNGDMVNSIEEETENRLLHYIAALPGEILGQRLFKKEAASYLLEKGAFLEMLNSQGETPLLVACEVPDTEFIEFLLGKKAKAAIKNKLGQGAHFKALCFGNFAIAQKLDYSGYDDNSNTPLHIAAAMGALQVVEMLLEKEWAIDRGNKEGDTPLHVACKNNQYLIVVAIIHALLAKKLFYTKEETETQSIPVSDMRGGTDYYQISSTYTIVTRNYDQSSVLRQKNKSGRTALDDAIAAGSQRCKEQIECCSHLMGDGSPTHN